MFWKPENFEDDDNEFESVVVRSELFRMFGFQIRRQITHAFDDVYESRQQFLKKWIKI